jgi:outer membrane protein TolC
MLLELGTERRVLTARLNVLLHRPPGLPLPPPPAALPPPAGPPPVQELTARALAARPELASLDAEIEALEAALALARLEGRPDFEAMASYNSMWADREHRFMVGLGLSLPVRKERLAAVVAAAELRLAAARSRRALAVDRVSFEVEAAAARLDGQRRIVEIYADRLLPASGDQVRAALSAFKTGSADFVAVIEAEQNHRHAELGYHQALAAYHTRRAELAKAVGEIAGLEAQAPPAQGELP